MKKVTHYVCDYCGGQYEVENLAKSCEARHQKIIKINGFCYRGASSRYPETVYVEFESGEVIRYGKN